jgi:hypothetical protein
MYCEVTIGYNPRFLPEFARSWLAATGAVADACIAGLAKEKALFGARGIRGVGGFI